jgi:hypothetical protein
MPMWDDVKKNMLDWYDAASDKTGELARVGLRRYDIFGISRDIERHFSEIGSIVFTAVKEDQPDVMSNEKLLELVERVKVLEADLASKQDEIETIKQERREKPMPEDVMENEVPDQTASMGVKPEPKATDDPDSGE